MAPIQYLRKTSKVEPLSFNVLSSRQRGVRGKPDRDGTIGKDLHFWSGKRYANNKKQNHEQKN